jgi:hypothetical protein
MDRKLTSKELETLLLLYKFRFVTVELLTQITGVKSGNRIRLRLQKLMDEGLIGRRYDASYRIQSRHAEYYLLKDGIAALRNNPKCDPKTLHNLYKDRTAAPVTVALRLAVARISNLLHGADTQFLTQSQLASFTGLPKPTPNGLMLVRTKQGSRYFFVEVLLEAEPYFVALHRRLKRYITYTEENNWGFEHKDISLPTVLIICDTPPLQKRLTKRMTKLLDDNWDKDLRMYSTNLEALLKQGRNGTIWHPLDGSDVLQTFDQILNV